MRRALAWLLLVLIGIPLISPLLLADPRPEMPACCRRDGKHHCAMPAPDGESAPAGPAVRGLQAKCQFYPKTGALPANSKAGILAVGCRIVAGYALPVQVDAPECHHPRLAARHAERKRGPPPAFS